MMSPYRRLPSSANHSMNEIAYGQVLLVRQHEVEPAAHQAGALGGGLFRPAGHAGMRRIDGAARLARAHARHAAELVAAGRVADLGS
jgi:hypothetical protein